MKNWMTSTGRNFMELGKAMRSERGAIDIGGILMMGIGMVFIAVGFIMFPIVTTATDGLLAYSNGIEWPVVNATANTCYSGNFTGFTAVVGITPLLVLVGYLSAAVFSMFLGVQMIKGGGSTKMDLGTMLLLGISLIFIAIGLIILPVALDGICTVLYGGGAGINAAYTGLGPILSVTPLLLLISFIAAAVISGFFGIKKLAGGG